MRVRAPSFSAFPPTPLPPVPPAPIRSLSLAREAFIAAIQRDTPGTDLPRLVAVLDALLAWSAQRPELLAFRAAGRVRDGIDFERVRDNRVAWSARIARGRAPTLEIASSAEGSLSDERRAHAIATLNAHSREIRVAGDRLRIGFGALKNADALAAVLALLDTLLDADAPPATCVTDVDLTVPGTAHAEPR